VSDDITATADGVRIMTADELRRESNWLQPRRSKQWRRTRAR
jgi:hypothetical protein